MHKKGFTLIELLVVVAIVGILATIVFASLSAARSKAKIAAWKSELTQFRNSLELHILNNNVYPSSFEYYPSNPTHNGGLAATVAQLEPEFALSNFVSSIPEGLTTFIYYNYSAANTLARCPNQGGGGAGQTYAITFDTTNFDLGLDEYKYNETNVGSNTYRFYCLYL